jgi:hypothetical protein
MRRNDGAFGQEVNDLAWQFASVQTHRRSSQCSLNRLLKNTVRAERSGVSHGVEACKPLIDLRPVFRLRFATLNTNGLRGVFQHPVRFQSFFLLSRQGRGAGQVASNYAKLARMTAAGT